MSPGKAFHAPQAISASSTEKERQNQRYHLSVIHRPSLPAECFQVVPVCRGSNTDTVVGLAMQYMPMQYTPASTLGVCLSCKCGLLWYAAAAKATQMWVQSSNMCQPSVFQQVCSCMQRGSTTMPELWHHSVRQHVPASASAYCLNLTVPDCSSTDALVSVVRQHVPA